MSKFAPSSISLKYICSFLLVMLFVIPVDYVFGLGEEIVINRFIKGGEKASKRAMDDLKPENRQKQRWRAYDEESVSYDARESARNPNKYWREKEQRERDLRNNATTDHSESDKRTHKRYKKIHNFFFGDGRLKQN